MKEIYWINVIGGIGDLVLIMSVIAGLFFIGMFIASLVEDEWFDVEDDLHLCEVKRPKVYTKAAGIAAGVLIFLTAVSAFVPTKKEMYLIYGVGSVVDYVQQSNEAKQLLEKTIRALNVWVDSLTESDDPFRKLRGK